MAGFTLVICDNRLKLVISGTFFYQCEGHFTADNISEGDTLRMPGLSRDTDLNTMVDVPEV